MTRSRATLDRDYKRSIDHKIYLELQELNTIDWETVEGEEVQEYLDSLYELESECENETLCLHLQDIISNLEYLLED